MCAACVFVYIVACVVFCTQMIKAHTQNAKYFCLFEIYTYLKAFNGQYLFIKCFVFVFEIFIFLLSRFEMKKIIGIFFCFKLVVSGLASLFPWTTFIVRFFVSFFCVQARLRLNKRITFLCHLYRIIICIHCFVCNVFGIYSFNFCLKRRDFGFNAHKTWAVLHKTITIKWTEINKNNCVFNEVEKLKKNKEFSGNI